MTCREVGNLIKRYFRNGDEKKIGRLIVHCIPEDGETYNIEVHPVMKVEWWNNKVNVLFNWKTRNCSYALPLWKFCNEVMNLAYKHRFLLDDVDMVVNGREIVDADYNWQSKQATLHYREDDEEDVDD